MLLLICRKKGSNSPIIRVQSWSIVSYRAESTRVNISSQARYDHFDTLPGEGYCTILNGRLSTNRFGVILCICWEYMYGRSFKGQTMICSCIQREIVL